MGNSCNKWIGLGSKKIREKSWEQEGMGRRKVKGIKGEEQLQKNQSERRADEG